MRKLTYAELNACNFLRKHGPWTPGDAAQAKGGPEVMAVLHSLVKKRRATVSMTDDGPQFAIIEGVDA